MNLDSYDRKIMAQLELDSSQAISNIAKKIKRSKEFVNFRIKRLEKEDILQGYSAIIDMSKFGYFTFRIYIKWQNSTEKEKQQFYDYIKIKQNIWTTTVLHGKWDFAFFMGVKSIQEFHKLWDQIQLDYKHKIAETKIAIYAPIYNYNKRFFSENKKIIERVYGNGPVIDFDFNDEKLVSLLAQDIRAPHREIAQKLKLSTETVRKKIKFLEQKKVIVGYKINPNLQKMGFQGYRVDFALNSVSRNKELFEYIKQHKYFYQINKSIGGSDFECEVIVKSLTHLLEILEETVKRFSSVIKSYEYFGYTEFPTLSMVPS